MFFRRNRPRQLSFEQRIENLKSWGFQVHPEGDGSFRVRRDGCEALVRRGEGDAPLIAQSGRLVNGELARLVDGGYQKFWLTAGGRRAPALASELKVLHGFEEDLREALGLMSLYNTSLGTVNALHLYDRLQGRDRSDAVL
ncbi:MAG: hypothetical protein RMI94_08565 [Bryobacterales bacterium]|nr:hypothetical protein [Bryobacterales bacterium]